MSPFFLINEAGLGVMFRLINLEIILQSKYGGSEWGLHNYWQPPKKPLGARSEHAKSEYIKKYPILGVVLVNLKLKLQFLY